MLRMMRMVWLMIFLIHFTQKFTFLVIVIIFHNPDMSSSHINILDKNNAISEIAAKHAIKDNPIKCVRI